MTIKPTSERSHMVGNITEDDLVQQRAAQALSLGEGDFLATLTGPTPGEPKYVVGHRVDGRAYDEIVLHYGGEADNLRTWRMVADHGASADYRLADDTTSHGWATVQP